jgi:predicted S18 family serine protease
MAKQSDYQGQGKLEERLKEIVQKGDASQKGKLEERLKEITKKADQSPELKDYSETEVEKARAYQRYIKDKIEEAIKARKSAERDIEKLRKESEDLDKTYDYRDKIIEWLYSDRLYDLYHKVGVLKGHFETLADFINKETDETIRMENLIRAEYSFVGGWLDYNEATFTELKLEAECAAKNFAELKKSKFAQEHFSDSIEKIQQVKDELESGIKALYGDYQEKLKQLS